MQSKRASDEDQTSGRKRLKVYQNIQPQNNLAEGESDFENNTDDAFIDDDNDDNDELESRTLNIDQFRKENIDTNSEIDDAIRESDSAFTLESFDIKEDLKEGKFDESGNFIRSKSRGNSDDEEDEFWLQESVTKGDYSKNTIPMSKLVRDRPMITAVEALYQILFLMPDQDKNIIETLAQLNKDKKRFSKIQNSQCVEAVVNAINILTDSVETLERKEFSNVYQMKRQDLVNAIKEEPTSKDGLYDPIKDRIWQYKWLGKDKVYGFYTCYEMQYWKENYFQNRVLVRLNSYSESDNYWVHISNSIFDTL